MPKSTAILVSDSGVCSYWWRAWASASRVKTTRRALFAFAMFEIDLFCGTLRPIVPLPVLGGAHSLLLQSVLRVAFRPPTRFLGVGFPRAETRFPFAMAKLQSCFGNARSPRKIAWQNEPL